MYSYLIKDITGQITMKIRSDVFIPLSKVLKIGLIKFYVVERLG